jgi:low temperature requirement protein LtrA
LFTIIVLGETIVVVALGTSGSEWELVAAVVAALGFVAAAAIWWAYFGAGGEVTMSRSPAAILVFTHGHIPLLAALTAFSAGITLAIEGASADHLDAGARWALAGGAALYLACLTAVQLATEQGLLEGTTRARTLAVIALVVLALFGGYLVPVVFVGLTAATLVLVVIVKLRTAQRLLRSGAA